MAVHTSTCQTSSLAQRATQPVQGMAPKIKQRPAARQQEEDEEKEEQQQSKLTGMALIKAKAHEPGAIGKHVSSAVAYALKKFSKKDGWTFPDQHFKSLSTDSDKKKFVQELAVDPEGAWLKVMEQETLATESKETQLQGKIALWEVARLEGLPYNEDDQKVMAILHGLVEDCESEPHPKKELASKGHKV